MNQLADLTAITRDGKAVSISQVAEIVAREAFRAGFMAAATSDAPFERDVEDEFLAWVNS